MHHHRVALLLHPPQQLAHPALAHAHLFRCFPLRHLPVAGSFQPVQPVPFLLAHRDSFHPSASRLSIGTFYLAQLGTFHLAATPSAAWCCPFHQSDKIGGCCPPPQYCRAVSRRADIRSSEGRRRPCAQSTERD